MPRRTDSRRNLPRVEHGLTVVARHESREQVCILENASSGGAGLRINPHFHLPKRFTLILENMAVPVVLKWRRTEQAGVRFDFTAEEHPVVHRLLTGLQAEP